MTKRECTCYMFKCQGICWHTGYKPDFRHHKFEDTPKRVSSDVDLTALMSPMHIRAYERVRDCRELRRSLGGQYTDPGDRQ